MQILEKPLHGEHPAASKLCSPLRAPLIKFFSKHPVATIAYFLTDAGQRLFSERQDYFWLLHDLTMHPDGVVLLDTLCAATDLWEPILDRAISDLPRGAAKIPDRYVSILHLMMAITEKRPRWLAQHAVLWRRVVQLWEHPGMTERLKCQSSLGVHERAEATMLAKLILSYVHETPSELPRLLDIFQVFQYPARFFAALQSSLIAASSAELCLVQIK
jgi:hypothetical protein